MAPSEAIGWIAAVLTLLTFSMRSMRALRLLAIAANVSFIAYGAVAAVTPVLVLHLLLLPCNLLRLYQLFAGTAPASTIGAGAQGLVTRSIAGCTPSGWKRRATGRDWLMVSSGTADSPPAAAGRGACASRRDAPPVMSRPAAGCAPPSR